MNTHHTQLPVVEGMPFEDNWGSFNTYVSIDGTKAVVVEWRTGRVVKRFKGETAYTDADRWAYDLHIVQDVYDWVESSPMTRLA